MKLSFIFIVLTCVFLELACSAVLSRTSFTAIGSARKRRFENEIEAKPSVNVNAVGLVDNQVVKIIGLRAGAFKKTKASKASPEKVRRDWSHLHNNTAVNDPLNMVRNRSCKQKPLLIELRKCLRRFFQQRALICC